MCNRGYEVVFIETRGMIIKCRIGKLVEEGIGTSGNVYYIKEKSGNICYLSRRNKCWL